MKDSDAFVMFPGKLGIARKIITLMEKAKKPSAAVADSIASSSSSSTSAQVHEETSMVTSKPVGSTCVVPATSSPGATGAAGSSFRCDVESYFPTYSVAVQALLDKGEIFKVSTNTYHSNERYSLAALFAKLVLFIIIYLIVAA